MLFGCIQDSGRDFLFMHKTVSLWTILISFWLVNNRIAILLSYLVKEMNLKSSIFKNIFLLWCGLMKNIIKRGAYVISK